MKAFIKPPRLQPGDTIAIVSPSSPPTNPRNLDHGVATLEELGYRTLVTRNARQRHGFLAGSDRERAADLMSAFASPKVNAIFCMRGGHGATRLLPLLDYGLIRRHPKIFMGYSDITALHCALLKKSGLVTFHGPMLNADFVTHGFPTVTRDGFFRTLTQSATPGGICQEYHGKTVSILREGVARGQLIGGNLTMLCALLDTPWQPSFRGKILFLEEVNEAPYRIDRMLTQLLNAGLLQQVVGVAIGLCHGCFESATTPRRCEFHQSLMDVLRERLLPLKIPVVTGLPFGHVAVNATLPVGMAATLDGHAGDLIISTPAVS